MECAGAVFGKTKKEVLAVMGKPWRVTTQSSRVSHYSEGWRYPQVIKHSSGIMQSIEVRFRGDKCVDTEVY